MITRVKNFTFEIFFKNIKNSNVKITVSFVKSAQKKVTYGKNFLSLYTYVKNKSR